VQEVFSYYQQGIDRIHREFPNLTVVHVTAPLMTIQTGPKAFVKKLLGRAPGQFEDNMVREQFNELVRQTYRGREPVFDLARLESSTPGAPSRTSSSFKGETAYGLLPEYTTDGGHLTGPAEQLIAAEFLRFLANVAVQRDAGHDPSERPRAQPRPALRCNLWWEADVDPIRRKILKAGAGAAAIAATAPHAFAHQRGSGASAKFYERGSVRIRYDESGSGFPLLLIAGGGLNSLRANLPRSPFDPIAEFANEFRCIYADLRNAINGESSGPLEVDRPWDAYTDDHVGLMDHLGIDKFMVLGFCIGGPFIWNILERAPAHVAAAVIVQPVGFRPENPNVMYDASLNGWGAELRKRRPEITQETVEQFVSKMFRADADFVFTVSRDFVRNCQTPVLIMPDDVPSHPYAVAMEAAMLAPKSELSMFPWKEPKERIPVAVRQVRSFLRAHRPRLT
jgi:pimeloyl-ACP methyl ester carboxylesterase